MQQGVMKTRVLGIDISVEETTYAIIDIRGNILAKRSFCTSDYPDVNQYVTVLSQKIVEIIEDNNCFESVRSIGISTPSGNPLTGCIENSPNLPWKGVIPLAAMLRDRLGLAVALSNDSHAVALGEQTFGCAHGMKNFIIVTIGNGLGCTIFSNKKMHVGQNGFAGEFGHTCVAEGGRPCGCGLNGCLERYVSGKGIVVTAKEMMEATDKPTLMRDFGDKLNAKDICDCCDKGDEMAIEVYRQTGHILGRSLATLAAIFDPEAIIIAGGVSKAGKWLGDPTQESFDSHIFKNIRGKVKLILSTMSDRERDILGASVIAWEVQEYSLFK